MIERKVFFNSSEIEPVDQRTCEPGFFRSVAQSRVAEALVLVAEGARWIVDLTEGERQFLFYRLQPNDRSSRFGMLTRDVMVEVDRDGAYEADMLVGSPGDMILSDGKWFVVAVNSQGFRDPTPIGLWDAADLSRGNNAIGFKSWRLVVGTGQDREVVWQRVGSVVAN